MRAEAESFERVWEAHLRGVEPVVPSPAMLELVAVAEGLRSIQQAVAPEPAEAAWDRLAARLDREFVPVETVSALGPPRRPRRRAALRIAAAAAAVFAAVAAASLRATPGSVLYPLRTGLERTALLVSPDDGALHLRIAEARLGDLVHALEDGPEASAPGLARALVAQREAAVGAGLDVHQLDADIREAVPSALAGVPFAIALEVQDVLGDLLQPVVLGPATTGPGTQFGNGPQEDNLGTGGQDRQGQDRSGEGRGGSDEGNSSGDQGNGSGQGGTTSGESSTSGGSPQGSNGGSGSSDQGTDQGSGQGFSGGPGPSLDGSGKGGAENTQGLSGSGSSDSQD